MVASPVSGGQRPGWRHRLFWSMEAIVAAILLSRRSWLLPPDWRAGRRRCTRCRTGPGICFQPLASSASSMGRVTSGPEVGRIGLKAAQLLVGFVQLAFQVGDLLLQRGDLVVKWVMASRSCWVMLDFLGVQLAFCRCPAALASSSWARPALILARFSTSWSPGFGQPVTDFTSSLSFTSSILS